MLSEQQLEALLGRPLTPSEHTNYETYIDIAEKRLSNLLCFSLSTATGERVFDIRHGYRTVYLDPFTTVTSVTVDENVFTTFVKKQNDSYQGEWFNSLEFDDRLYGKRITVEASWGFGENLPNDLAQLLAAMFGIHDTEVQAVKSKEIEDFRVTYSETPMLDSLILSHSDTIRKYAQCERAVAHGLTQPVYHY